MPFEINPDRLEAELEQLASIQKPSRDREGAVSGIFPSKGCVICCPGVVFPNPARKQGACRFMPFEINPDRLEAELEQLASIRKPSRDREGAVSGIFPSKGCVICCPGVVFPNPARKQGACRFMPFEINPDRLEAELEQLASIWKPSRDREGAVSGIFPSKGCVICCPGVVFPNPARKQGVCRFMPFEINPDRLEAELEQLASISDAETPAVTRIVFTEVDLRARAWLKEQCHRVGLHVREDAVGNTFARWPGTDASLPAVATGSHIDAIPNAGRYDGTVGVLGGLEAIRSLKAGGFSPTRSIELLLFTSEEPTRFGLGCLGSRMLSGALHWQQAAPLRDHQQATLDEVRQAAGFHGELSQVRLSKDHYSAFLELHIEQGPLLEQQNVPIGLVQRISAPASLRVTIEGQGGHAGAVLMPHRRDALTAAAELILDVERIAQQTGSIDSVATTGICDVFPGAVNSIPSRVSLGIDIRDVDLLRRDSMVHQAEQAAGRVTQRREVTATVNLLNADPPAACDPKILDVLRTSCEQENLTSMEMVSRAYHDSLFMSLIVPTAMLFIPCRAGVSHRPDEFASPDAIANGVRVLARALASLAS